MIAHQQIFSYANYLGRSRHTCTERSHGLCRAGGSICTSSYTGGIVRLVKIHHRMMGHGWARPPLPPAAVVYRGLCFRLVSGVLLAHLLVASGVRGELPGQCLLWGPLVVCPCLSVGASSVLLPLPSPGCAPAKAPIPSVPHTWGSHHQGRKNQE